MIPDMRLIGFLVVLVAIIGAGFFGYRTGTKVERADWQEREIVINAEHAAKLQAATERARAVERAAIERYSQVDADYQRRLKEVSREKDRALAGVRAGAIRLSIPAECPGSRDSVPNPAPAPGERDGGTRARLSDSAAQFLVSLASEADAVVEQLRACQAVLSAR